MAKKVSHQSTKSQKTKLLNKARVLFWKKGYHATSIRDIADAFGCKPANIYNYFPNKESMLFTILREEMETMLVPIIHLEFEEEGDPLEQLTFFIRNHAEMALSNRRSSKLLFDSELDSLSTANRRKVTELRDQYDRILRAILMRGSQAGQLTLTDVKLASIAIASIIARARLWFSGRGRVSKEAFIAFVIDFVLNGLKVRP